MAENLTDIKRKINADFKNLARLASTFAARLPDQPKKTNKTEAKKKPK